MTLPVCRAVFKVPDAMLWTVLRDVDHVVRWTWTSHHRTVARVLAVPERFPWRGVFAAAR